MSLLLALALLGPIDLEATVTGPATVQVLPTVVCDPWEHYSLSVDWGDQPYFYGWGAEWRPYCNVWSHTYHSLVRTFTITLTVRTFRNGDPIACRTETAHETVTLPPPRIPSP